MGLSCNNSFTLPQSKMSLIEQNKTCCFNNWSMVKDSGLGVIRSHLLQYMVVTKKKKLSTNSIHVAFIHSEKQRMIFYLQSNKARLGIPKRLTSARPSPSNSQEHFSVSHHVSVINLSLQFVYGDVVTINHVLLRWGVAHWRMCVQLSLRTHVKFAFQSSLLIKTLCCK